MGEMMKASGGFGTGWMTDLINNIVKEGCIPDDWRKSIPVHVYKGKGDPLVCGSYRAIKLLEKPIKVLERVLEKKIRCQVLKWKYSDADTICDCGEQTQTMDHLLKCPMLP